MAKAHVYQKDHINTDEIIPARYLNVDQERELAKHCMEDLDTEFLQKVQPGDVIVAGEDFGCGSSREHAPWALEINGIHLVIAESYARIFRQNMFNCGMIAAELPGQVIDHLFKNLANKSTTVTTDIKRRIFQIKADGFSEEISFALADFDIALITAGGWLEYAEAKY